VNATEPKPAIVDYDTGGYDYRGFWQGKDYEHWSETRALRVAMRHLGRPRWLADFGGGFGRNAVQYLGRVDHAVLIDYSRSNLTRAAQLYEDEIASGHMFLLRADLNQLPFVDAAFDSAIVVRVLHHLPDLNRTLREMGRVVGRSWILDVPIKDHALGMMRGAVKGDIKPLRDDIPRQTGNTEYPFFNFKLEAVRRALLEQRWDTTQLASVNNFRRWDRRLPNAAVKGLAPLFHALEVGMQSVGKGWWGPSQFVLALRQPPGEPLLQNADQLGEPEHAEFSRRVVCPACKQALRWSQNTAHCANCRRDFVRDGAFWDFAT
jgi:SAM-dependent methyltransferase